MSKHLNRELESLKRLFLELGTLVEENVVKSIKAYDTFDSQLANEVVQRDQNIDAKEIELEEECLKILALYRPVATQLRFIISILKINNNLERIGDLAANMAKKVAFLANQSDRPQVDFTPMMDNVKRMLKDVLDAFVNEDAQLAKAVCTMDDEVDRQKYEMKESVKTLMAAHPEQSESLFKIFSMAHHLERMADHCTNIAEDIIYFIDGDIIRHNHLTESVSASSV